MITVACVCVPPAYDSLHVERLQDMVAKHLNQPFQFHVITESDKQGWFAKIDLFQPGRFEGRVLYLDLDVTVVGNLDEVVDYPHPFVICRDFQTLGFNSSVMAWDAGEGAAIHERWSESVMEGHWGDQTWIQQMMPHAATFPRKWMLSWRGDVESGRRSMDDARIIVYHGQPKPWDLPEGHLNASDHPDKPDPRASDIPRAV